MAFRGAIEHLEVVRVGWPLPATWVSISGKLWFWSNGGTKTVKKVEFSCWNRLYEGTVFRLVFSQAVSSLGGWWPSEDEDHTSGCVAHMAVLAGKLWFLGKSRSKPLCHG